jgi:hypothetical protein
MQMCKMVERRTWGSQSPLRQFGNIPEVIVRKLEKNRYIHLFYYVYMSICLYVCVCMLYYLLNPPTLYDI